jgi:hypothetical protein
MSVKRTRCTEDVQKKGIAILRETMKLDMPDGVYRMLKRALGKFDLAMIVIKELRERAERYQERDLKERGAK